MHAPTVASPVAKRTSLSLSPSKLSPEGKTTEADVLRLGKGFTLSVEFEASARTRPRLVLKEKQKQQFIWPLDELSRIDVAASGDGEPHVRFWLRSDQEPFTKFSCSENDGGNVLDNAFKKGVLRPGPKVLYIQAREARELLHALQRRKADGFLPNLDVRDSGGVESSGAGEKAAAGSPEGSTSGSPSGVTNQELADVAAATGLLRLNSSASSLGGDDCASVVNSVGKSGPSAASPTNLVFVCSPHTGKMKLPQAKDEAIDINNAVHSFVRRGGSAQTLRADLAGGRFYSFVFTGHGDSKTLGFTDDDGSGALSAPEPDALASLLAAHELQLVVLNGCSTESLARKVRAAGVPHVVCWRSAVEDGAARLLVSALLEAHTKHGRDVASGFKHARNAVLLETREAYSACGQQLVTPEGRARQVPKYELRCGIVEPLPRRPEGFCAPTSKAPAGTWPLPFAAGVPLLLSVDGDLGGDVMAKVDVEVS